VKGDVDIVIWAADGSAATEALRDAGFMLQPVRAPELIHVERKGVPVTLSSLQAQYANTAAVTRADLGGVATTDTWQSVAPSNTGG
jgi:hypothetical protein